MKPTLIEHYEVLINLDCLLPLPPWHGLTLIERLRCLASAIESAPKSAGHVASFITGFSLSFGDGIEVKVAVPKGREPAQLIAEFAEYLKGF